MMTNKELGDYLRSIRESLGYSTHDINRLCEISQSYISLMENGKRRPSPIILKKLSSLYFIDCNDLYEKAGYDELIESNKINKNQNSIKYYNFPVYGQISAGLPNWAEECLEGYLPIDPNMISIINPEECFFLRVNGESMNKVVRNGAYALIRKQDIVENGEIAAVLVNGDSATIKKFTKQGNAIALEPMSDDSSFKTQIYDKNTTIKILGKYIGKFEINN